MFTIPFGCVTNYTGASYVICIGSCQPKVLGLEKITPYGLVLMH